MSAPVHDTVLMVFAKAPVSGQVKTRLIPALGADGASRLHQKLLIHTLESAARLDNVDLQLHVLPDTRQPVFQEFARQYSLSLHQQQGSDLGERMANAFAQNLGIYSKALVMGTDCPSLTPCDYTAAIKALDQRDAVIVPAHDGGYVLLGLRYFAAALFTDIDWSTDRVMAQTCQRLKDNGFSWSQLPPHHDIDRPDDLIHCSSNLLTGVKNEMAG